MVELPNNDYMCDKYIDNGIMFGLEQNTAWTRLTLAGPVVVDAIFRLTGEKIDCNWSEVLSAKKLAAEHTPDTSKKVLGWIIDTSRFRIFLPIEKCIKWTEDIKDLLKKGVAQTKELESTIGCLNHAGHIIPLRQYFLNWLRFGLQKWKQWGCQQLAGTERT